MTTIEKIADGAYPVEKLSPMQRRKLRKILFRIFLERAQNAHPFNESITYKAFIPNYGLVCQYSDGAMFGESTLSMAYRNLQ